MKRRPGRRMAAEALCAELYEDDGVDPRLAFSRVADAGDRKGDDRKTHQLCKQAVRALTAALAVATGDRILRDLEIVRVEPAPDSSRLCVYVTAALGAPRPRPEIAVARLGGARGFLRAALAAEITRKRVPDLTFAWQDAEESA